MLVAPETDAAMDKAPPTAMFADAGRGLVMETATVGVGVGVALVAPPPEPQPAIATTRIRMIPKRHSSRRRPRIANRAPIKLEYRFISFDTSRTYPHPTGRAANLGLLAVPLIPVFSPQV